MNEEGVIIKNKLGRKGVFILKIVFVIRATYFYLERMLCDCKFLSGEVIMGDMMQVCFTTTVRGLSTIFFGQSCSL